MNSWVISSGKLVAVAAMYAIAAEFILFYAYVSDALEKSNFLRAATLLLGLGALVLATYVPSWGRSTASGFLIIFMLISAAVALPDPESFGPPFVERVFDISAGFWVLFMWVMIVISPSAAAIYILGRPEPVKQTSRVKA